MPLLKCPDDRDKLEKLIPLIDYTNALTVNCSRELLESTCDDALLWGFASVPVFPSNIPYVTERLRSSNVKAQIAVGFPTGGNMTEVKLLEAKMGLDLGAGEIDMVMNISKFAQGEYSYIEDETCAMVELAKPYGVGVKLIIECCYWTDEQKLRAGGIAVEAGCEFIKTSTGMGPSGATLHDVNLLHDAYGDRIKIKAAGKVPSIDDAWQYVLAGASRIAGRHFVIDQMKAAGLSR